MNNRKINETQRKRNWKNSSQLEKLGKTASFQPWEIPGLATARFVSDRLPSSSSKSTRQKK
jgi:hypothetical protein